MALCSSGSSLGILMFAMAVTFSGTPPFEYAPCTASSMAMFVSCMRSTCSMSGMRMPRPPRTTRKPSSLPSGDRQRRPEKMSTSLGEHT